MGCCLSIKCEFSQCFSYCFETGNSQGGDAHERTHLLADPVSNSSAIHRVQSDDLLANYPNSLPKKADEQSALNKILQEAATNVIDVAALGSHNMEQHEYLERMNRYHSKIAVVAGGFWHNSIKHQSLLIDIPAPERILTAKPINIQDYLLIKTTARKIKAAMADVKVEHKEDLVVPFQIP